MTTPHLKALLISAAAEFDRKQSRTRIMTTPKPQHTPGPWIYDGMWSLIMAGKHEIAAIHAARQFGELKKRKRIDEAGANARLIASAPELLAALKRVLDFEQRLTACQIDGGSKLIADIKAILQKATGDA